MTRDNEEFSEGEEVDPKAHKRLLEGISRIDKTQHIKKPTRSEPAFKKSEFHLVKPQLEDVTPQDSLVSVRDLLNVLKKNEKHIAVGKQLQNTVQPKKILQRPLEKTVVDKIQRTVGYEKVKKQLKRWDAVVAKQRSNDHQVFPLNEDEMTVSEGKMQNLTKFRVKDDLILQLEAVQKKHGLLKDSDGENEDDKTNFPLTLAELKAKRKEMAKLRMRESLKISKARKQKKIKSKKYHKLMKREKLKEQIKMFEGLQKTDPDAALAQLELLERQRVEERATLRHRNTGAWAKNMKVRAKYDKDARQELAEQLIMSREITQQKKLLEEEESSDEEVNDNLDKMFDKNHDPFNPWMKKGDKPNDVLDFVSGYRKYWDTRNTNEQNMKTYLNGDSNVKDEIESNGAWDEYQENGEDVITIEPQRKKNKKLKIKKIVNHNQEWFVEDCDDNSVKPSKEGSTLRTLNDKRYINLDDLFGEAEDTVRSNFNKKLDQFKKAIQEKQVQGGNGKSSKHRKPEIDLEFKKQNKRPIIDEAMDENLKRNQNNLSSDNIEEMKKLTEGVIEDAINIENNKNIESIDPSNFVKIIPKHLMTAIPRIMAKNCLDDDKNDDPNLRKLSIIEAFNEDDIVADFKEEKENEIKKDEVKDVDLTLPGWGSWSGCGIDENKKKKNKRLIFKLNKKLPRKDNNNERIIINEKANDPLKLHQVSELPFPFTSVRDYEASIRQPIGSSFVPETAFRLLTKPAVVTKQGAIIEPMDEGILLKENYAENNNARKRKFKNQK